MDLFDIVRSAAPPENVREPPEIQADSNSEQNVDSPLGMGVESIDTEEEQEQSVNTLAKDEPLTDSSDNPMTVDDDQSQPTPPKTKAQQKMFVDQPKETAAATSTSASTSTSTSTQSAHGIKRCTVRIKCLSQSTMNGMMSRVGRRLSRKHKAAEPEAMSTPPKKKQKLSPPTAKPKLKFAFQQQHQQKQQKQQQKVQPKVERQQLKQQKQQQMQQQKQKQQKQLEKQHQQIKQSAKQADKQSSKQMPPKVSKRLAGKQLPKKLMVRQAAKYKVKHTKNSKVTKASKKTRLLPSRSTIERYGSCWFNCVVRIKDIKSGNKLKSKSAKGKLSVSFNEAVEILGGSPRKASKHQLKPKAKAASSSPIKSKRLAAAASSSSLSPYNGRGDVNKSTRRSSRMAAGNVAADMDIDIDNDNDTMDMEQANEHDDDADSGEYILPNELPEYQTLGLRRAGSPMPPQKLRVVTTTVSDEEDQDHEQKQNLPNKSETEKQSQTVADKVESVKEEPDTKPEESLDVDKAEISPEIFTNAKAEQPVEKSADNEIVTTAPPSPQESATAVEAVKETEIPAENGAASAEMEVTVESESEEVTLTAEALEAETVDEVEQQEPSEEAAKEQPAANDTVKQEQEQGLDKVLEVTQIPILLSDSDDDILDIQPSSNDVAVLHTPPRVASTTETAAKGAQALQSVKRVNSTESESSYKSAAGGPRGATTESVSQLPNLYNGSEGHGNPLMTTPVTVEMPLALLDADDDELMEHFLNDYP